jgi:hypothetical protein
MANKKLRRIAWITPFVILASGAALYSISLLVALGSEGTAWNRYVPLFRDGQDVGFLVLGVGVLNIVIVALSVCIGWMINQLAYDANVGNTRAVPSNGASKADAWRSYKQNRIVLLVLVLFGFLLLLVSMLHRCQSQSLRF